MTLRQLIENLEEIERRGLETQGEDGRTVDFSIHDPYSIYGESAEWPLNLEHYFGYGIQGHDGVRLDLYLKTRYDGKKPKITFRKPS